MGFHLEASHHEVAIGQHEIDFRHADALSTADNLITFRWVVKAIAARNNMHATFMPKPLYGENGSGMHVNQSLSKGEANAFFDPADSLQLSAEAYGYIAGLMEHLPAITAVANPTVNSYKRLIPGYEAPVYIAWSPGNRSAAIRVPAKRGRSTRAELRTPDPTANPYLAFSAMLAAGMDGIRRGLRPPAAVNRNIYHLDDEESTALGIRSLPHNLEDALTELETSSVMRTALGDHILEAFVSEKRAEWADYREQVHQWEIDRYMDRY
jgi:glutamine synthetase